MAAGLEVTKSYIQYSERQLNGVKMDTTGCIYVRINSDWTGNGALTAGPVWSAALQLLCASASLAGSGRLPPRGQHTHVPDMAGAYTLCGAKRLQGGWGAPRTKLLATPAASACTLALLAVTQHRLPGRRRHQQQLAAVRHAVARRALAPHQRRLAALERPHRALLRRRVQDALLGQAGHGRRNSQAPVPGRRGCHHGPPVCQARPPTWPHLTV